MMLSDEQVIGHEHRHLAGRNAALPARSVEPSHPDNKVVMKCKIDAASVRIRALLVLPLEIPQVEAWIWAPESCLELRNGLLVAPRVSRDSVLTVRQAAIGSRRSRWWRQRVLLSDRG